MPKLILSPIENSDPIKYSLYLREGNCLGGKPDYTHIANVTKDVAYELVKAGPISWFYNSPEQEKLQEIYDLIENQCKYFISKRGDIFDLVKLKDKSYGKPTVGPMVFSYFTFKECLDALIKKHPNANEFASINGRVYYTI